MNKIIFGLLISVLIGFGAGYAFASKTTSHNTMPVDSMGMSDTATTSSTMSAQMEGMVSGLEGKVGDDFDKAFLEEMITHHKGAVDMSLLAQKNAKHIELKQLSQKILTTQLQEIQQMQQWLRVWYTVEQ